MEIETLFTDQKWNILRFLSKKDYSPLELADLTKTSRANISQQLRLLDAADLVKKNKVSNRDKGKPRAIYSLTSKFAYLVVVTNKFAEKRLISLNPAQEIQMRSWFLGDEYIQYYISQACTHLEPFLDKIKLLMWEGSDTPSLIVVGDNLKPQLTKISPLTIKKSAKEQQSVRLRVLDESEFRKTTQQLRSFYVLYDPEGRISGNENGEPKTKKV